MTTLNSTDLSTDAAIISLKRRRDDIKTRLGNFQTFLVSMQEVPDIDAIETRLENFNVHFMSLYSIHEELIALDAAAKDVHTQELLNIEGSYDSITTSCRKLIRKAQASINPSAVTASNSGNSSAPHGPTVKLPKVTLPEFDGSIEEWQAFKDKFLSRIGNNINIPDVDKLQYLQSSLSGKALRSINSIESTGSNYQEAWKILTKKFDNSRKAVLRHLTIMHQIPRLSKDSPNALDELVDTFRQHLRALDSLGVPIQGGGIGDACIIHLLLSKISDNTKYQWEITLPDNKMPSYTHLLDFLERRGSCTDQSPALSNNVGTKQNHNADRFRREARPPQSRSHGRALIATPNTAQRKVTGSISNRCLLCPGQHPIYACSVFKRLSVQNRRDHVKRASLCFNCLWAGHTQRECERGGCKRCGEQHNTLLHIDPPVGQLQPNHRTNTEPDTSLSRQTNSNSTETETNA